MQPDILTVTVREGPASSVILVAAGEIDRDSRDELDRAADEVLSGGVYRLMIDVAAVSFCDSSGLSLFIDLHRRTRRHDGWLRLVSVPPYLREMLRVTHLDEMIEIA